MMFKYQEVARVFTIFPFGIFCRTEWMWLGWRFILPCLSPRQSSIPRFDCFRDYHR